MKINNIKLTNYRSHSSFEANFTNGINLLLGKNGAGKSSILEAIGITLFDAKPRTTLAETIKIGERSARVIIEFTGNDENNYKVERRIGAQSITKLFFGSEEQERYSGVDATKKIKELVGLKENADVIYKNVITAEQNKFTEIFQLTEARRVEEFNRIFNTEIYRKIYEKFSLDCYKSYNSDFENIVNEINIRSSNLQEISILQQLLKNEEDELKNLEVIEQTIRKALDDLEINQNEIERKLKEINELKRLISTNNSRIEEKKNLIKRLHDQYEAAQIASKIVKENLSSYQLYQEIEKNIKIQTEKIKELEKLDSKKRKVEIDLTKNEKEILTLNNKINSNSKYIESKQSDKKIIEDRISELEIEIKTISSDITELEKKISKIILCKNDFSKYYKQRQKNINEIESIRKIIDEKNIKRIDEDSSILKIEEIKNKLEKLDQNRIKKITLETEKEQLNVRFKILNEAKNQLKGSICPYLEQKCKNIDDDIDSDVYFKGKLDDINLDLTSITQKLESLKGVEKEIEDNKNLINSLNNQLLNNKTLLIEIERYEGNINLLNETLSSNLKDFEILLSNYILPFDYDLKNLERIEKDINNQFEENNNLKVKKDTIWKNNEKNVAENKGKLKSLLDEIDKLNIEIQDSKNKIQIVENQRIENLNIINQLNLELIELPIFKNKFEEYNKELDKLKPAYILYTQNLENSNNENKIKSELDNENESISSLIKDNNRLEFDLVQKDENSILEQSKSISLQIKAENEKNVSNANKMGIVKSAIGKREKEIEENLKIQNKISTLKDQQKLLEKKINLTKLFREKINIMGTIVASRLLTEIANKASENYFNISQKNEIIEWINDENNKYQVYLIDKVGKVKRKYEVLSGGEQVSVAISLRTALAESLTSASFAIFDEPTVNLDKERKELLSRSLHKMLEKLQQVLVVTHDDTFQEMAEAIEV